MYTPIRKSDRIPIVHIRYSIGSPVIVISAEFV
jgi:hypothetical protein